MIDIYLFQKMTEINVIVIMKVNVSIMYETMIIVIGTPLLLVVYISHFRKKK